MARKVGKCPVEAIKLRNWLKKQIKDELKGERMYQDAAGKMSWIEEPIGYEGRPRYDLRDMAEDEAKHAKTLGEMVRTINKLCGG